MSYTKKEKEVALKLYDETESIAAVINKLGYPRVCHSQYHHNKSGAVFVYM